MPTFRWIIPLAAVALIHAPASAERQKTWQKTFTVTTHPSVKISGGDGSVHVRTGPAGTVYAEVLYEYKRWGFTTTPRDPAVTLEQKGNDIEIGVREPTRIAIFGGISEHLVINVTVPANAETSINKVVRGR